MSEKPGFSGDITEGGEPIHTPGGMAEPPAGGLGADGADIASTDMSATPSSRAETTQPVFGEGRDPGWESEMQDLRERHLRLAAEFDNYRKRNARERAELVERAQAGFVGKILDVLDDLDRVVAGDPATPVEKVREAVDMIDRKLRKELEAAGVERIDPVGKPFDPAVHEAVAVLPPPDASKDNTVSATFQVGYRFKGGLVRPARVQVYSDGQG